MKLRKLYSNTPVVFGPITFRDGLNVVLGSVRRPKNSKLDTHNLGKTTLAQVIDFCLLRGKSNDLFLFKYPQFSSFEFYLEVELHRGGYVTVRRTVTEGTKASFMLHDKPGQDFTSSEEKEWTHWLVAFEKARDLLDSIFDLRVLSTWSYRKAVAYALRTQKDYDEPFKLAKFAGKHADWKPFLAHMLGLDAELVARGYALDESVTSKKSEEVRHRADAGNAQNQDQMRGLVAIAERDVQSMEEEIEQFDLAPTERRVTKELVSEIDQAIATLNEERYAAQTNVARIEEALRERLSLDVGALEKLFAEAKIYFSEQVKKDYTALVQFNRELLQERDRYLRDDLRELEMRVAHIEEELRLANVRRTSALKALSDAQALAAFKRLSGRLTTRKSELEILRVRSAAVQELAEVRRQIRALEQERAAVREELEVSLQQKTTRTYSDIKRHFDDAVFRVIDRHANLYSRVNDAGHPEFNAEIVDEKGNATSAGDGFSYGRLLCIAFDMAVLRTYAKQPYIHFVYHDGALETLDDRKKLNLISLMRSYEQYATQQIITVIESELPHDSRGEQFRFSDDEVIVRLHDGDQSGRLFRMPPW